MMTHRALVLVLSLLPLAPACNEGYDTEEATSRCEEDKKRIGFCFDIGVMEQCIGCYEECGGDCKLVSGAVCSYSCE